MAWAWLNNLMEWVAKWVPRLTLVRETHRAVQFRSRGRVREHQPGLVVWWPLVSDLVLVDMTERSALLSAQLVAGRFLAVAIVWQISDAKAAARRYRRADARVENAVRGALTRTGGDVVDACEMVRAEFEGTVRVIDLVATSEGFGLALKNFTDSATREPQSEV